MSTFMLKNTNLDYTPVSNIFIEKYMPKARGEFVKVYLLMLKHNISNEPGVSSSIFASSLNLLESDVMNALNYWNDEEVIRLVKIDKMNNYSIEFLPLSDEAKPIKNDVNLLHALNNNETSEMLKDIERIVCRPLSSKEMETYLSWQTDFGFSYELILILIEYCASKGKNDYRYIEKVAIAWHEKNIKTIEQAQTLIKQTEDKWIKIRKVLSYLGIKNGEIMKPQEELIEKWLFKYNFDIEIIEKASEVCFLRLNRADFKYIDGILTNWFNNKLTTLEAIAEKDTQDKQSFASQRFPKKNSQKEKSNSLKFNNFTAREYDYDSLEKKLLGWDNDD